MTKCLNSDAETEYHKKVFSLDYCFIAFTSPGVLLDPPLFLSGCSELNSKLDAILW